MKCSQFGRHCKGCALRPWCTSQPPTDVDGIAPPPISDDDEIIIDPPTGV